MSTQEMADTAKAQGPHTATVLAGQAERLEALLRRAQRAQVVCNADDFAAALRRAHQYAVSTTRGIEWLASEHGVSLEVE